LVGEWGLFLENNAERALQWAVDHKKEKPAIIGAVIDLGYCMDLIDSEFLKELKEAYLTLKRTIELTANEMPINEGSTPDKLLRRLDCAVIEMACKINADAGFTPYDSVRGVFWEGNELYPDTFFKEKNHIQICVRNPNCIKGYFLPREINDDYLIP
jgi:hypothetical protein